MIQNQNQIVLKLSHMILKSHLPLMIQRSKKLILPPFQILKSLSNTKILINITKHPSPPYKHLNLSRMWVNTFLVKLSLRVFKPIHPIGPEFVSSRHKPMVPIKILAQCLNGTTPQQRELIQHRSHK